MSSWKIWVDTGGTFTDCIATDPEGRVSRLKVLSNGTLRGKVLTQLSADTLAVQINWPVQHDIYSGYTISQTSRSGTAIIKSVDVEKGFVTLQHPSKQRWAGETIEISTHEEVPVFAARLLTSTTLAAKFPRIEMKLGSTRGTNAILEKKGARTALLITKGFKDLLVIGNQQRPDLFALHVIKEDQLYTDVIEVDERLASDGSVITPCGDQQFKGIIDRLRKKKIESVAIAFLNSYKNPVHEQLAGKKLKKAGFQFVSTSHELSQQIRILQRTETTVANAYLAPIIHNYIGRILNGLPGAELKVMTSAGGLANASEFHPKDSLLSGPAGGVVGAAVTASLSGVDKLITFDMGGTSTDVSLYNGRFDYRYESKVGSLKILSPSLAIETIAAGGGSVCSFDGYKFTVGPESAGASPGPACYGAGGPLTITDVNLLLGHIDPKNFTIPLSVSKAEEAIDELIRKTKRKYSRTEVLHSLAQIANEKMAGAIRKVSTQSGHNPADYTLLSFGGAGGQHACALASMLNMKSILIPYDAGLLSAYGIGHAKTERFVEKLVLKPLESVAAELETICDGDAEKKLVFLRFKGQENSIEVDLGETGFSESEIRKTFRKHYERIFSHWLDHTIEIESVRLVFSERKEVKEQVKDSATPHKPHTSDVYKWEELKPGATITGPALVVSNNSTTVVSEGWVFSLDSNNNAILQNKNPRVRQSKYNAEAELELFTNRFTSVAYEMGAMLQRTSFSINVKERLDFSCAVLDADGYLVVNAPHIPVHLGSLGVCVREVVQAIELRPGDVIITNHPAYGGSHLPDVTLIKGVFVGNKLVAYVANRAHHAEIGGKKPGSMPADATTLEEEGVIVAPTYLVRNNKAMWDNLAHLFQSATWPTRLWEENRADLNGALAAVNYGEQALIELCDRFGAGEVKEYMLKIRKHAAGIFTETLKKLALNKARAVQNLDDGSPLKVTLSKKKDKLVIDFTGSSDVHPGNLNATRAIVQSVVLYVIRLMVNKNIPMNEGLMDHVNIVLPQGLLNPDFSVKHPPAVVGGNTEVSQRLTDTLLKALNMAACSQGTMNNFLFGNEKFGYYETICGGTGAGKGFDGTSAVHQHMTNTRISDPELLEWRFPIRLVRFEVRKNSGGKGKWRGGDGIVREFLFTQDLDINILSQHRAEAPYGLGGGQPGKTGRQYIIKTTQKKVALGGMDSATVSANDRLIIETPGGGGYGR
ncbi:MAG TPA: hydantoinase B/oxoprolinase family protein [Cyclobacteriaceae bacterium]|nr:hydantoinase B/oxoprolinase family protein [Cyclobacteriaceae bacterium]